MPIPGAADVPDTSAIDAIVGEQFGEQRYPVTNKYQKTGNYAPYRNEAAQMEEQKKIQDALLNEEIKMMSRDPSSERIAPVDAVMGQAFPKNPSYGEQTQYPEDSYSSAPKYVEPSQSGYGKVAPRMNGQAPKTYFDAPFNKTPTNLEQGNTVSSRNPYQIDKGVSTPLGTTPMERQAIEEAIKRALQNAAQQGAAAGNVIPMGVKKKPLGRSPQSVPERAGQNPSDFDMVDMYSRNYEGNKASLSPGSRNKYEETIQNMNDRKEVPLEDWMALSLLGTYKNR